MSREKLDEAASYINAMRACESLKIILTIYNDILRDLLADKQPGEQQHAPEGEVSYSRLGGKIVADKQPGQSDSSTTSGELNVVSRASESTDSIPTVGKQMNDAASMPQEWSREVADSFPAPQRRIAELKAEVERLKAEAASERNKRGAAIVVARLIRKAVNEQLLALLTQRREEAEAELREEREKRKQYEWSESDNERLRRAIAGNFGPDELCSTATIKQLEQACIDDGQRLYDVGCEVINLRQQLAAEQNRSGHLDADVRELRQDLEEVNEFARSLGHGQGAIDNGLVDCLRESFAKYEQLRRLVREFQNARSCRVKWGDVMPANISVYGQVFEDRDEYIRFNNAVTQLSGFPL